jgi:hypothetical protein
LYTHYRKKLKVFTVLAEKGVMSTIFILHFSAIGRSWVPDNGILYITNFVINNKSEENSQFCGKVLDLSENL